VYVGSAKDDKYDQVLDCFTMGPLQYGVMQFELESNAPDYTKIPQDDVIGVTAIILTISYKSQEFFRIGYYVYNNYTEPELLEIPPEQLQMDKIYRNILADKPRLTRFDIKWGFDDDKIEEMKPDENGVLKENTDEFNKGENSNGHLLFMMNEKSEPNVKDFSGLGSANPFLSVGLLGESNYSHQSNSIGFFQGGSELGATGGEKNPFL